MTMTNPTTPSVKDLLAAATPLPWIRPWGSLKVHAPGHDDLFGRGAGPLPTRVRDAINAQANLDLATFAVNHLPDYEAAVEALERLSEAAFLLVDRYWSEEDYTQPARAEKAIREAIDASNAALRRLRGES